MNFREETSLFALFGDTQGKYIMSILLYSGLHSVWQFWLSAIFFIFLKWNQLTMFWGIFEDNLSEFLQNDWNYLISGYHYLAKPWRHPTMVFCYQNCTDLLWEKIVLVIEKNWRPRICKFFEIIRTIYSSSERSEEFLVTECFFNLFLKVSQI